MEFPTRFWVHVGTRRRDDGEVSPSFSRRFYFRNVSLNFGAKFFLRGRYCDNRHFFSLKLPILPLLRWHDINEVWTIWLIVYLMLSDSSYLLSDSSYCPFIKWFCPFNLSVLSEMTFSHLEYRLINLII